MPFVNEDLTRLPQRWPFFNLKVDVAAGHLQKFTTVATTSQWTFTRKLH